MSSSSKKKTTFAKMNREIAVRERRIQKQAKKDARKLASAAGADAPSATLEEESAPGDGLPAATGERDE